MGVCFSQEYWVVGVSDGGDFGSPTAKVVSASGQLHQYALPITVSDVLGAEISSSSSSSRSSVLFLCNSDSLCYEEFIPEMVPDEQLFKDQIYFALPRSRLGRPLSASDMAALAVKASLALQASNRGRGRRGRKSQISPVLEVTKSRGAIEEDGFKFGGALKEFDSGRFKKPVPPPPPARKYRRSFSSRRFKGAVRSFRIRLSTIEEAPESVHSEQCCRN